MKPLSIRIQKILTLIPIINLVGIFVLIYQCHTLKLGTKMIFKTMLLVFPMILFFALLMMFLDKILGVASILYQIMVYAVLYLLPAGIFSVIVFVQKNNTGDG